MFKSVHPHLLVLCSESISSYFVECHDDSKALFFRHQRKREHAFRLVSGLFVHKVTEFFTLYREKKRQLQIMFG